jgi:hypothetical protein
MDYHGLVKRLQLPDGYLAPRELSYQDPTRVQHRNPTPDRN